MAKQLWLNNFDTELTGVVKALPDTGSPATELGYGIIQLPGAMGTVLPALTGGDWFLLTLFKVVGGLEDDIEIVKVTSTDTSGGSETRLTVERGYEGTTVRAFAIGDKVSMRMTAGSADNFVQKSMNLDDIPDPATALANLGGEPVIAPPGSAPTDKFWRGDKTWADFAAAARATVLTGLSTATNAVITASDTVIGALGRLQKQISDHFASTANAHPASAIQLASDPTPLPGSLTAGTVQQRMEEIFDSCYSVSTGLIDHKSEAFIQHSASTIGNTPAGNIAATDVQAAINELDSEKFSKSGGGISGNVSFTGPGRRITGTFSGVPVANRTLFQTPVANESTTVGIIPNGTGNAAYLHFSNSSDPDNSAYGYIGLHSSEFVIVSTALGSGTKLPINIDGILRIGLDGTVLAYSGGGLGYGTGSGGTATQTGSRTSGVILNKPSGRITLVSAAGTTAWQSFTVTNSVVGSADTPIVAQVSGTDLYEIHVTAVATGSFRLSFRTTGGTTTEQPVFKFEIHKGATS